MTLTTLLEKQTKRYVSLQLLFFSSLTHHTCLDPINAGRDETHGQMKWESILMTQVKKIKPFLVHVMHCATDIKASKLLKVLYVGFLGSLSYRFYEQTAVTFSAHHFEYSQGKKQFSQ